MPIKYKIEILPALKAIGYTQTRIREEKLIGQATLSQLRRGELVSWATIETLCRLLECQPGDILEYIPDDPNKPQADDETDALRAALLNQIKGL
jgi:putative transcriptional regulator